MYHQPLNKKLILESWHDFQRRLRWRIFHSFGKNDNSNYDPDYDLRAPSENTPPYLPQYLELGLIKGRIFVNNTISKIPDEMPKDYYKPLTPSAKQIKEFLISNNYIVTMTDKNLGLAVSERTWIITKCLDILNNKKDYTPLSSIDKQRILDKKCSDMKYISALAQEIHELKWSAIPKDLPNFLGSKVTEVGGKHVVPTFYGIPKIHKQPVKMRPIIPCHSAIMNPAAKYVSKQLKPLIEGSPTIIHGSKDLAIKLSKLSLTPGRHWYIVTGDVVAFYPNIPLNKCLDIVYNMWYYHVYDDYGPDYDSPINRKIQDLFKRCLYVGNTELVTQFQNKFYLQNNGLAMGVADSPDLANLYGAYFETKNKVLENPAIAFYGRYIDDCLAIVYAESEQEALQKVENIVKFDECVIEWNVSASWQPFLDMALYKDENYKLQHMPYRKAGNHQERVPWISHHPLDVKRGTFIGEMSRLATLSTTLSVYKDAIRGLVALYIRRGYPADLVNSWMRNNIRERWNNRLHIHKSSEHVDVLVLKTEFNLAWNYFNANELSKTIFGYWKTWLSKADKKEFSSEFPAPPEDDKHQIVAMPTDYLYVSM